MNKETAGSFNRGNIFKFIMCDLFCALRLSKSLCVFELPTEKHQAQLI